MSPMQSPSPTVRSRCSARRSAPRASRSTAKARSWSACSTSRSPTTPRGSAASWRSASRFRVSSVNGRIMLAGSAPNAMMVDQALTVAKQFGADVINSVKVAAPQQVMLEVRFVEASRSASRELGVNWQVFGTALATGGTGVGAAAGLGNLISGSAPFGSVVGRLLGNGVQADGLLQALEERGVIRRLAEPNLTALSGDTASLLAGGG